MTDDNSIDFGAASNLENVRIEVMLKDASYRDREGNTFPGDPQWLAWRPADVRGNEECEHTHTLCTDCAETWALDWWVAIIAPDGTRFGLNNVPGLQSL